MTANGSRITLIKKVLQWIEQIFGSMELIMTLHTKLQNMESTLDMGKLEMTSPIRMVSTQLQILNMLWIGQTNYGGQAKQS